MTDTCVCCGQTVPEGRMVCPGCERKTEERCGQMESWGEKLVELEERAKSNSHRISDLEADNKALHQLTASVQVLAAKQQTVEENVQEIKRDVKTLKNIPARRWEGVLRAVVTAAAAGPDRVCTGAAGTGGVRMREYSKRILAFSYALLIVLLCCSWRRRRRKRWAESSARGSRSAARRPGFISGRRKMKIGASMR